MSRLGPTLALTLASQAPDAPVRVTPAPLVGYDVRAGLWRTGAADVWCDDVARGRAFVVPSGTTTDLSTVPRPLWALVAPFELSVAAPLMHDWLYRHGGAPPDLVRSDWSDHASAAPYTRAEADALFRDLLAAEGVARWRRAAAYTAVRAFGGVAWRRA